MIASGRQIREGRELLGLSQAELATAADVALALIVRAEASDGLPMLKRCDAKAIYQSLEAAAIVSFAQGVEAGVRSQKPDQKDRR